MKKILLASALALTVSAAWAQVAPGPFNPGAHPDLNSVKSRVLEHIQQRMHHLRKDEACVEHAFTFDQLRHCRPEFPGGPREFGPRMSPQGMPAYGQFRGPQQMQGYRGPQGMPIPGGSVMQQGHN